LGETRETPDQYVFTREVQAKETDGLGELLVELGRCGFSLELKVQCRGSLWPLTLRAEELGLAAKVGKKQDVADSFLVLPEAAVEAVADLETLLAESDAVTFADVAAGMNTVAALAIPVQATLTVSLAKKAVNQEIEASVLSRDARVITFLSPLKLAKIFETTALDGVEKLFFTAGLRTVFVNPGMMGALSGDLLAAFGQDQAVELDEFLEKGLSPESKKRVEDALNFCDWQCDWQPGTPQWLTPEVFSFKPHKGRGDAGLAALGDGFERLRSLLSLLFLSRRTRRNAQGSYEINFGHSPEGALSVTTTALAVTSKKASDLHDLYRFAYAGSFVEKPELVRQFLERQSLTNPQAVFDNARVALQAAAKAHESYLKKKVDEYLEAQRKSREYIQEEVRDGEKSIMEMSKEVAESVYKTFGAAALVVVAKALDSRVSDRAGLVAALVLAVYLLAVVFFYLPTVRRVQKAREQQFADHIESFRSVLTEVEMTDLLQNRRVLQAWEYFESKRTWASKIYISLLVLSAVAIAFYLRRILS